MLHATAPCVRPRRRRSSPACSALRGWTRSRRPLVRQPCPSTRTPASPAGRHRPSRPARSPLHRMPTTSGAPSLGLRCRMMASGPRTRSAPSSAKGNWWCAPPPPPRNTVHRAGLPAVRSCSPPPTRPRSSAHSPRSSAPTARSSPSPFMHRAPTWSGPARVVARPHRATASAS